MEDFSQSEASKVSNNPNLKNNEIKLKQTKYQQYKVPKSIIIGEYTYVFKAQHKTDPTTFTYRWQKYNFKVSINKIRENLNKISKHNKKNKIEYTLKKIIM
jgi:ketol-acid reductoisomerase